MTTEQQASKPVLDALLRLFKLRQEPTLATVASWAGIPRAKALKVLADNSHLLVMRGNKIVRYRILEHKQEKLFAAGKVFVTREVGYEKIKTLEWRGHDDLRVKYTRNFVLGFLGDSREEKMVPHTPEIEKELRDRGLVSLQEVPDDIFWKESV
jgi:hypothetical protein